MFIFIGENAGIYGSKAKKRHKEIIYAVQNASIAVSNEKIKEKYPQFFLKRNVVTVF